MSTYQTTEDHFRAFTRHVQNYLTMFGLIDWRVRYVHEQLSSDTRAEVSYNCTGRIAVFKLSTEWEEEANDAHLQRSAYHEVMELLLGPIRNIAHDTNMHWQTKDTLMDEEAHKIIRRLENVYLGSDPC